MDDVHADLLVCVSALHLVQRGDGLQKRDATAGDDALLDGRAGSLQGILDAVLDLLELDLGGCADLDNRDATGELGHALLELLLVKVGVGVLDLALDLVDAILDGLLGAGAIDDGGVVLGDLDGLGTTEHLVGDIGELDAQLLHRGLSTGDDGDVLEHALAAVTVAGGLDGAHIERATQLVEDEGRQSLAVHVLGDDEQRGATLLDGLEHGQNVLDVRDLLIGHQDVGVLELGRHGLVLGGEVR